MRSTRLGLQGSGPIQASPTIPTGCDLWRAGCEGHTASSRPPLLCVLMPLCPALLGTRSSLAWPQRRTFCRSTARPRRNPPHPRHCGVGAPGLCGCGQLRGVRASRVHLVREHRSARLSSPVFWGDCDPPSYPPSLTPGSRIQDPTLPKALHLF